MFDRGGLINLLPIRHQPTVLVKIRARKALMYYYPRVEQSTIASFFILFYCTIFTLQRYITQVVSSPTKMHDRIRIFW